MKKLVLVPILLLSIMIGGCGSGFTPVIGGVAGGFAASETLKGVQADLEKREQVLLDRYAGAVKSGAKQEVLSKLENQVTDTQFAKEGIDAGKKLLGVDWNNPKEAGESIAKLGVLAYLFYTKKKLLKTEKGVSKFMANTDKETANKIYDKIIKPT